MIRKDREVSDKSAIFQIVENCKVCRLAMCVENKPYLVPMNFGYNFSDGTLTLYFHCAKKGQKLDILRKNPQVFFEMDDEHQLVESEIPCDNGFTFASVMGSGTATFPSSFEEKEIALNLIMKHQCGKTFMFNEKMTNSVEIIKVVSTEFTGKRRGK